MTPQLDDSDVLALLDAMSDLRALRHDIVGAFTERGCCRACCSAAARSRR